MIKVNVNLYSNVFYKELDNMIKLHIYILHVIKWDKILFSCLWNTIHVRALVLFIAVFMYIFTLNTIEISGKGEVFNRICVPFGCYIFDYFAILHLNIDL